MKFSKLFVATLLVGGGVALVGCHNNDEMDTSSGRSMRNNNRSENVPAQVPAEAPRREATDLGGRSPDPAVGPR